MEERTIEKLLKDEYELQHYGFSSTDFLVQFQDIINTRITENINDVKRIFSKKYSSDKGVIDQLTELENALKEAALEDVLKTKTFQDKVRDIFKIPDNILLPNDLIHGEDFGDDTISSLTKEIEELEKQYKTDELLINLYDQEIEMINKLNPIEETYVKVTERLKKWPKPAKFKKNLEEVIDLLELEKDLKNSYIELFGTYDITSEQKKGEIGENIDYESYN